MLIHTHACVYTQHRDIDAIACAHLYIHIQIYVVCRHLDIHPHASVCVPIKDLTCIRRICVHSHMYVRAYIYIYIHMYIQILNSTLSTGGKQEAKRPLSQQLGMLRDPITPRAQRSLDSRGCPMGRCYGPLLDFGDGLLFCIGMYWCPEYRAP